MQRANMSNALTVTLALMFAAPYARYRLAEVANLSRVLTTISGAHWIDTVAFSSDTIAAKRDPATCARVNSPEEADDCHRSVPYEQLRFRTADGELISRTNIAAK